MVILSFFLGLISSIAWTWK